MRRIAALLARSLVSAVALAATLAVGACSSTVAPGNAQLSQDADAPGYVVVGLAEQNATFGLVFSTQSVTMNLVGPAQQVVPATRKGCGTLGGFINTKPCDLTALSMTVLRLPAGTWSVTGATLAYHNVQGDQQLNGAVPPVSFQLRPGEIVDLGDYVFASNADTNQMKLVRHFQDDGLTRTTLATYPGLRAAPTTYRGGASVP